MSAPEQLTIHGELVPYPSPRVRRLTERQRELVRYARWAGVITKRDTLAFYADPAGALRRLERAGQLCRRDTDEWVAV